MCRCVGVGGECVSVSVVCGCGGWCVVDGMVSVVFVCVRGGVCGCVCLVFVCEGGVCGFVCLWCVCV